MGQTVTPTTRFRADLTMNHPIFRNRSNRAFTLVEILVVLVIASIVLAIAIPRIRTVNKERNLREAARVVGSAFANASQRALIDGIAGVRVTRNANFDQGGYLFAATEISLLRAVPNYSGDALGAGVTAVSGTANTVTIPRPLEQDSLDIIQLGDSISFGTSSFKYRITGPTTFPLTGPLTLNIDRGTGGYMPMPAVGSPYIVHRKPRVLRSSKTSIPDNYIVDLRFSGFEVVQAGMLTTVFDSTELTADIDFIFDEDGSVDRVFYQGGAGTGQRTPLGPAYFFITEAPDSVELTEPVATDDESSLWVTVNSTGTTNIGYNNSTRSENQTYSTMLNLYTTDRTNFNRIVRDARSDSVTAMVNQ